jgi:putative transposase
VDVGIKTLAVCSDGTVYENPQALRKSLSRLRRLDKSIARSRNAHGKNQHSNRRERKYRLRETVHARVRNIRNDAQHKAASAITAKPVGKVVVETLNVSGMLQNRRLSRALADASLAGFTAKLEYQCGWLGFAFEKVDRWFSSTRTCSECGAVRPNMDLSERTFVCHSCGVMIDRDRNAALNLSNAESYPASGRGAEMSPAIFGWQATAVKRQETAVRDNR